MQRFMRFLVWSALALAPLAHAQWTFSTVDPGATVWCGQPARAITIDGKLEEWQDGDFTILLDKGHLAGAVYASPAIAGGDADCSGRIGMRWEGDILYIAAAVRDDKLAPIDPKKGYAAPWLHDGLMVYLKAPDALLQTGRYGQEYRRDPKVEAFATLGLTYYQAGAQPRPLPGTSRYVTRAMSGGYILEAAIDLPGMGYLQPLSGDRFKLSLLLTDQDPGALPNDAFGQLIWELGPADSAHDPATWGTLCLLRDGAGGSVIASVQEDDGARHLYVKALLDARRDDTLFQGVQVIGGDGKVAVAIPANQPIKPGRRLVALADAHAATLGQGTYTVRLMMKAGAKTVTHDYARVTFAGRSTAVSLPPTLAAPDPARVQKLERPSRMKTVTKDDYLAFAEKMARQTLTAYKPLMKDAWKYGPDYGMVAAYLYQQTKDPFYAETAKGSFDGAYKWALANDKKQGWVHTEDLWLMVKFMREGGLLTPADEPRVRELLITSGRNACVGAYDWNASPYRRGTGHSSLGPATARWYVARAYPEIPEKELFTRYFNLTWNDWWQYRDTSYNDTSYRALWMSIVLKLAYLTGEKEEIFTDPEARKLWERMLYTIAPNGAVPHYGNTNGWATAQGLYIFFMEYLATKTRDGRYKTAAHRAFDYMVNHSVDVRDYHFEYDTMMHGAILAHMVADDTVKEAPLGGQSRLLTRKETLRVKMGQKMDFGSYAYFFAPGPKDVPDKLIFKSDERDEALWAMIDACDDADHNAPGQPTNVVALMENEAVLGCDQGYMDKTLDLHNVVYLEDIEGTQSVLKPTRTTVPEFTDWKLATTARVCVANYQGFPVDEERRFFFVRNAFLLMKDTVTFRDSMLCRLGPCWQTQQIHPIYGANWADTAVPSLFLTGLGTGGGLHRWKNPARDLLVYHPAQPGRMLEMLNRYQDQPWRVLPLRLRYTWKGLAKQGERLHFTTLLLPHAPVTNPAELAAGITTLADSLTLTALRITAIKDREDWVVLNDTGDAVTVGELETDARQMHLTVITGRTPSRHLLMVGGKYVKLKGETLARAEKETVVDRNL
jgi:hypothetical protein